MKMLVKEQVKALLAQEGMKMKDLVVELENITGRTYSLQAFSQRLSRGTLSYNEVLQIAEILGYEIKFEKVD